MTAHTALYRTLGVPVGATVAEIKRAFRKLAKMTHPDHGGDRAQFEAIESAHAVLANPERRAKYDATGEVDDTTIDQNLSLAMGLIGQMIQAMLIGEIDPLKEAVLAEMTNHLKKNQGELGEQVKKAQRAKVRADKLRARFKHKTGGANRIVATLDWSLRTVERQIASLQQNIEVHGQAIAILAEYEYTPELVTQLAQGVYSFSGSAFNNIFGR